MENIFTKVMFFVNLKGKKINKKNEEELKKIIQETKNYCETLIENKLEKEEK